MPAPAEHVPHEELARAVADAERRATQQAALVRAAKALNATLRPDVVLDTLCAEAAAALGADMAVVYAGRGVGMLMLLAAHGLPAPIIGHRPSSTGLVGRVLSSGEPLLTNDYQHEVAFPRTTAAFDGVRSAVAVPLRRGREELDGVVAVGFAGARTVSEEDAELLSAFADVAGAALRNADQHAEAKRAATLDSLTGCLNHAAMQARLREEVSRAERLAEPFTLVLLDLHGFKQVNERFGHLTGDTVLRSVGELLRASVRLHDVVARYGGDEFGLILTRTTEAEARPVVERAVADIARAPLPQGAKLGVYAGMAGWRPGDHATGLLERADAGMLEAKRRRRALAVAREAPHERDAAPRRDDEEARVRRLTAAARLAPRLVAMTDPGELAATAMREMRSLLSFDRGAILRLESGTLEPVAVALREGGPEPPPLAARPQDEGAAGRALRERRPVLVTDAARDPLYAGLAAEGMASELAVPLYAGAELWGAIDLAAAAPAAFDENDARMAQLVADAVGAGLRSAARLAELRGGYLAGAEALAAALETRERHSPDHARAVAELAVEAGRRLGLPERELRDLRLGATFHDIGKLAIPEAVLAKPGPLSDEERELIRRHPVEGEQLLGDAPALAAVRRIVRHDHERWDGAGYPDGLSGDAIPLGARIVFAADAYHAMRSDRPYRGPLPERVARAELREHAGTQFDPDVVDAVLGALDGD
ncbi:MAG TPA: HD domain-containing phosphohydrolase [Solirubrobacteraceae bacterium]|nr:HD domain-containing phosphohydrolase [Solirubrobacteraceae bacterium]